MIFPMLPILRAIEHKLILAIVYDGKLRTIEPHTLGLTKLRAYQLHPEEGWRLFTLDKIHIPTFEAPRPGYKTGDPVMKDGIVAELVA